MIGNTEVKALIAAYQEDADEFQYIEEIGGQVMREHAEKLAAALSALSSHAETETEWEYAPDAQAVEALPEGSIVLATWMHDKTERPYELVKYRLLRAVGAAHGKSPAQFAMPVRILWRAEVTK